MKKWNWKYAAVCCLCMAMPALAEKIVVARERTVNLMASGDVYTLFDEQTLAGDPKAGSGGAPKTEYTNGWIKAELMYPMESVVDLGRVYQLSDLYFYDINGSDSLYAWCGDGTTWSKIVEQPTSAYNSWVAKPTTCKGRYVRFKVKSPSAAITEVVLYGTPEGSVVPLPQPSSFKRATMGELIGLNGFIDDNRDNIAAVGNIREYHNWMWDDGNDNVSTPAYPNNQFGWNPSWVRGTGWGWNFDEYYEDLHSRGLQIAPVFQGSPGWMFGMIAGDSLKPMALGADSTNPAVYKAHADYMFQFAARFGSTVVPSADLRVDAQNTKKAGLGFVQYMEGWNEPDKDWKGKTGYFSPKVLSTLMSADYDGHQKSMGTKVGVKNADPNMKYVMPALISINLEYVKAMKYWADGNRGGGFPADVLNFHHYCTDGGGQGAGEATTGISPEKDDLRGRMETMRAYRDQYLPGKELWLSEFGWDTHPDSKFGAQTFSGSDEYETQGRWLVRAYLEIAAAGFDKAQMFMLRDTWDSSPGVFATSGLVHDMHDTLSPKYQKKPSWYYVNTMHKTMKNYRYAEDLSANGVRIYRFENAKSADSVAYVVWNPDDAAANKTLNLSLGLNSARVVKLTDAQALGTSANVTASANQISLAEVNGSPQFVFGVKQGSTSVRRFMSAKLTPEHRAKVNAKGARHSNLNTHGFLR